MGRSVSDTRGRELYFEARAQYDLHPSDYVEGVLTGLGQVLNDTSFLAALRQEAQDTHAAGRSAVARVRDFYRGLTAALMWVTGEADTPPIVVVVTEPTEGPDPPRRAPGSRPVRGGPARWVQAEPARQSPGPARHPPGTIG